MKTFEELYDEVEGMDVAEPACMDKVLAYMEELHEETQEYMQLLVEKLEHAMITWKQPWYQEPHSVLKVLKNNDDNEEASFLSGVMTKQECDLIEKNWLKFRKRFDVPDKLACFARWKNRDSSNYKELNRDGRRIRHLVCAFLARGLQRSTRQVYRHVVKSYGRTSRGIYTEKELRIIDICFHHDPKRAPVILSEVLARDPRAIYNRLHSAINGKPQTKRIKWNMELATKLLKLLIKITGEPLLGLKNKPIGIDVWRKLEEDFATKGEYLRHFWYTRLHGQLFIKYDVTLRRLRKKVFKILQRSPYLVWTDINWKEVAAELPDGFTYQLVYWVTVRVFRNNSNHFKLSMDELVNFGLERACSKKYGNKRLKTLVLTDEDTLKEIKYDRKIC